MGTAKEMVAMAASQIGTKESPSGSNKQKYGKWYGMNGVAWCDIFVSWCANQIGESKTVGKYAYTPTHAQFFKNKGQWISRDEKPQTGDIVFFSNSKRICHVGVVEKRISSSKVQTIEGNTSTSSNDNGGSVMRRTRSYGTKGSNWYIAGFGRPKYSGTSSTTSSTTTTTKTKLNGFVKENGKVYFYIDDVKQYGWLEINGSMRYFKSDTGERLTGYQKIYGEYYYLDPTTGARLTGFQKVTGTDGVERVLYFKSDTGVQLFGWQKIYDEWRYFDTTTGERLVGLQTIDGETYLLDSYSGARLTGWQEMNNQKYYFKSDTGVMFKNCIKIIYNELYAFNENGELITDQSITLTPDDEGKLNYTLQ